MLKVPCSPRMALYAGQTYQSSESAVTVNHVASTFFLSRLPRSFRFDIDSS